MPEAVSEIYYKAVRPDGTSFHDRDFRWIPEVGPVEGHVVTHRLARVKHVPEGADADRYLSVSVVATECTGMRWPCRLFVFEPVDGFPIATPDASLPYKRGARAWRAGGERPAHEALGPQGVHVAALVERARTLTTDDAQRLGAARDAAWYAARDAARYAARDAAWYAAADAAAALVVRDLITPERYDTLTLPWRSVVGRIHPDDAEVMAR